MRYAASLFAILLTVSAVGLAQRTDVAAAKASATAPATTPTTLPAGFNEELAKIDARALAHKDLTAHFIQEKHSPLLRKPLVSEGTVYSKGSRSLWVTRTPEASRMLIDPKWLHIYYPKQKVVEEYPIEGRLGMMASSPLPALSDIRKNFTLTPDDGDGLIPLEPAKKTKALLLTPSRPDLEEFVKSVRVLLDVDRGLVLAFELVDPDGEKTLIRFSDLKADTGLSDDAMKLGAPPGTKVSRPVGDSLPAKP
jgi:outer membrane lipoprotein-sorting protein